MSTVVLKALGTACTEENKDSSRIVRGGQFNISWGGRLILAGGQFNISWGDRLILVGGQFNISWGAV